MYPFLFLFFSFLLFLIFPSLLLPFPSFLFSFCSCSADLPFFSLSLSLPYFFPSSLPSSPPYPSLCLTSPLLPFLLPSALPFSIDCQECNLLVQSPGSSFRNLQTDSFPFLPTPTPLCLPSTLSLSFPFADSLGVSFSSLLQLLLLLHPISSLFSDPKIDSPPVPLEFLPIVYPTPPLSIPFNSSSPVATFSLQSNYLTLLSFHVKYSTWKMEMLINSIHQRIFQMKTKTKQKNKAHPK